ncbi:MAG: hypothetical protein Q8N45_05785, partial [Anaerolineales bacterium]|nr:hypothetical protein [Anaerolineales bacterium]
GAERIVSMPTAGDRVLLREALLTDLRQQALDQVATQLAPGDLLFPETLAINHVLGETYLPAEGRAGDALALSMQAEFSIQYVLASDLKTLAAAALDAGLASDLLPVADTLTIEQAGGPLSQADGVTRFEILISRRLMPNINMFSLRHAVQGLPPAKASQRLESILPLASPPQIQLVPSWWPWLPFLQFRILINT